MNLIKHCNSVRIRFDVLASPHILNILYFLMGDPPELRPYTEIGMSLEDVDSFYGESYRHYSLNAIHLSISVINCNRSSIWIPLSDAVLYLFHAPFFIVKDL